MCSCLEEAGFSTLEEELLCEEETDFSSSEEVEEEAGFSSLEELPVLSLVPLEEEEAGFSSLDEAGFSSLEAEDSSLEEAGLSSLEEADVAPDEPEEDLVLLLPELPVPVDELDGAPLIVSSSLLLVTVQSL